MKKIFFFTYNLIERCVARTHSRSYLLKYKLNYEGLHIRNIDFSTDFGLLINRHSLLNRGASRLGLAFNFIGGNLMDSHRDPGYPASGGASLEKDRL